MKNTFEKVYKYEYSTLAFLIQNSVYRKLKHQLERYNRCCNCKRVFELEQELINEQIKLDLFYMHLKLKNNFIVEL